ncbi:MAG: ABC transporter substrate-binding protein, partial [Chloroflexi bacterium]|nr:ABC transporter substrate-binding protein [Chloroflexota bacterium]
KIVANVAVLAKPAGNFQNANFIIVRKDLQDQVKTVADLKGKSIAMLALTGTGGVQLQADLKSGGLTLNDVNVVQGINFSDMPTALANKKVDAALAFEPIISQAVAQGIAFKLYDTGAALPDYPVEQLFYGPDFIKNQPDVGKRFITAYLHAVRDLQDAFTKGTNLDDIVQVMIKNTVIKDPNIWKGIAATTRWNPDGTVNTTYVSSDQDYYVAQGYQKQKLTPDQVVDNSFSEYAVQQLGPYKS